MPDRPKVPAPPDEDDSALVAARVRAVLAYAALSYEDASARTNIGASTLRRITSTSSPRGASLEELRRIAVACGAPLRWLILPWNDADAISVLPRLGAGSTNDRLRAIEHYLTALLLLEENRGVLPLPPDDAMARRLPSRTPE